MKRKLCILLCVMGLNVWAEKPIEFAAADPKGFLWYGPLLKKAPPQSQKKKKASLSPVTTQPDPLKQMKELQRAFKKATAQAVLNPTYDNVKQAQYFQERIMRQAETFQKMWQWVLLQDGHHWKKEAHGNRVHREILKEEERKSFQKNLHKMAETYGLFFFFKENCPYCHAFAPIVKQFAQEYGFVVKAVSADRVESLKQAFPQAVIDNGTIRKLNPQGIFPALFFVNPVTQEIIPLSWGMNALSVLEQQAQLVFKHTFPTHQEKKQ